MEAQRRGTSPASQGVGGFQRKVRLSGVLKGDSKSCRLEAGHPDQQALGRDKDPPLRDRGPLERQANAAGMCLWSPRPGISRVACTYLYACVYACTCVQEMGL